MRNTHYLQGNYYSVRGTGFAASLQFLKVMYEGAKL